MKRNLTLTLALGIGIALAATAQNTPPPFTAKVKMHHEQPADAYLPNASGNRLTTPSHRTKGTGIFTAQVNVNASQQNIVGDAANEPSITVDVANPNRIVIGWRQFDNVMSNFRQAGYGFSLDSGHTWNFPGVIEQGIFRSDPVLDCDANGNIYYNSLTSNSGVYTCKVFRSDDGGASWNGGTQARGGDKQWMAVDRTEGIGAGNIYSYWTSYYSSCFPGFFTRSTDENTSYDLCVEIPDNPYWGTLTVGNEGEVFVVGAGETDGVVVERSTSAKDPSAAISWDMSSYVNLDGYISGQAPINPVGLLGQACIDVDRSNGPGQGNLYVLSTVTRFSGDPADVMFAKSTDGGLSWSDPQRINTDVSVSNYQWFGTMSVAPNGRIDVIWLDTRDGPPGSDFSALYYSFSTDQGEHWSANERLSELFDPHVGYPQQDKMGDYFDMVSDETGANLAWANTLNGEQDVYFSRIEPLITGSGEQPTGAALSLSCSPNPFAGEAKLTFLLDRSGHVTLDLLDIYGNVVMHLANENRAAGRHTDAIAAASLPAGFYLCRLRSGGSETTIRVVKTR